MSAQPLSAKSLRRLERLWESPVTMHLASCRDLFPETTP